MKVLLVSEGEHEGSGALATLVHRVQPAILQLDWDRVSRNDIHTHRGKGQGFFKRAVRWLLEARRRGYDALVLVIDEDGRRERVGEIERAQEEPLIELRRALGVAIRTFDAWMLADERALQLALEISVETLPSPEDDRNPKHTCAALLSTANCTLSQRELYAQVAQCLDLQRLEERCPRGFAVFAGRLRAL